MIIIILCAGLVNPVVTWAQCETETENVRQCGYQCDTDDLCRRVCPVHDEPNQQRLRITFDVDDKDGIKQKERQVGHHAVSSKEKA